MEKNKTTLYHLILDRSGSMRNCIPETIASFNSQIETIKEVAETYPEQKFLVSLTVFNNIVTHLHDMCEIDKIKKLSTDNYIPNNNTALFDAIGESITKIDEKYAAKIENQEMSIVMVILTDGQENSSRIYNYNNISALIKQKEESSEWTISFLSADIDLSGFASRLNIRPNNIRSFSKRNLNEMTIEINDSIRGYARKKSLHAFKKDFFQKKKNSN